jgi:hypothetical protein
MAEAVFGRTAAIVKSVSKSQKTTKAPARHRWNGELPWIMPRSITFVKGLSQVERLPHHVGK